MPTNQQLGIYLHGAVVTQSPVHGGLIPTHGGLSPKSGANGQGAVSAGTSGWAATTGYTLTNNGLTASPDNGGGSNPDILGTGVVSSGTKTLILTCDFPAGLACDPGLKDVGTGISMIWKADGSGAFPYVWNGTNPRHAALSFACDFTARTVAASIDGVLKGTIAMPANFNNVRAYGNMQFGTLPYIIIDPTNWV